MPPSLPPEEITPLMQFIAAKTKNVTSPMNVMELCRQFKEQTGSSVLLQTLCTRIHYYRLKIHEMSEFDMETKVKMLFALGTPIDAGFLDRLKKVADVKVDDKQRIIQYRQKNGRMELGGKHSGVATDRDIIEFLVEKSRTTDKPIPDILLVREFKEKTGCMRSVGALENRYQRMKKTIYQTPGIDENTKIKMLFISNVKLPDETLKELRKNAVVEVDGRGRIIKYKGNDERLQLNGRHEFSSRQRDFEEKQNNLCTARWRKICEKVNKDELEEDGRDVVNWQKDYEKKRIDLVKFLIERTKNAKNPMCIPCLAADFNTEFKSSESQKSTFYRIANFRQRIHEMTQFKMSTKVKMMFALSAPVDTKFLEIIKKDAFVEMDEMKRIKKYKANDGSLELEGNHSLSAKANRSTREKYSQSTGLSQNIAAIQKGRKRARQVSEENEDGEPLKVEGDSAMDFDTNHEDDFDYDPASYGLDMEHIPMEKKPEALIEVKADVPEGPSTSSLEYRYEERFFDYDPPNYKEHMDMDHVPAEKKPENYIEVKLEKPDGPSTSHVEYHYEENFEHFPIEPKPEVG